MARDSFYHQEEQVILEVQCNVCGRVTKLDDTCSLCRKALCPICADKYLLSDCSKELKARNTIVPRPLSVEHTLYLRKHYDIKVNYIISCQQCIIDIEDRMIKSTPAEDLPLLVNVSWVYRGNLYRQALSHPA